MFIDKFYRLYNPYTKVGEPRSSTDPTLHFKDEGWDALSYKITNVSDGNDFQDVSTVGQTLMRKGDVFVQGKRKFDFLELDSSGKWDGKKRKIKNVEKGEDPRDVAIVEQTLVRKDEGFVQGENKYEFLESQNNNWDAKNKKIIKAAKAEQPNEVPTLEQVLTRKSGEFIQGENKYEFLESHNNNWDAKSRNFINVSKAKNPHEVPILEQMLTREKDGFVQDNNKYEFVELKGEAWDGRYKRLSNLTQGKESNDAVTLSQVPEMGEGAKPWKFHNKRLSVIFAGRDDHDCVIVAQTIIYKGNKFDAKNKQLGNLARGTQPNDAATVGQVLLFDETNNCFKSGDKVFHLMEHNPDILVKDTSSKSGFKTLDGKEYLPDNYVYKAEDGSLVSTRGNFFYTDKNDDKRLATK